MLTIRISPTTTVTTTTAGVVLRSDLSTFQLEGRDAGLFVEAIIPLLDGTRDGEAVAHALHGHSRDSVLAFLEVLRDRGLVQEVDSRDGSTPDDRWQGQRGFFHKWSDAPDELMENLHRANVAIVGLEPWGVIAARELAAAGVGSLSVFDDGRITANDLLSVRPWTDANLGATRREALVTMLEDQAPWTRCEASSVRLDNDQLTLPGEPDVIVAAVSADELLVLDRVARFADKAEIRYVVAHLDGLDAVLGPAVVPGASACWNCARLRRLSNQGNAELQGALHGALLGQRPGSHLNTYLAPMASMLGHMLALEVIKLVSGYSPSGLVGRIMTQNLITLATDMHTVVRLPWCDVCGGCAKSPGSSGGPSISESSGSGTGDSTQFTGARDPEDLRLRFAGLVDERVGIIKHLVVGAPDATTPDLPVTATAVVGSGGKRGNEHPELGSGKGLTAVEAMVGAVGESIERYSASLYRKSDLHRSSLVDLEGARVDPRQLCLYDGAQYQQTDFPYERFDPETPIDWKKGVWLDTGEQVWLPALQVFFNYRAPPNEHFCQVTSSGLAAGADWQDATTRALCELLERDAFMLTWLGRLPATRLGIGGTLEPGYGEIIRQLDEHGAAVELYHLDAGLGIPVVACLGIGDGKNWPGVTVALGAHLDLATAVRKAILEQGHVGPYITRLMKDDTHLIPESPEAVRTLTDHALFYVPTDRTEAFDFLRVPPEESTPVADMQVPAGDPRTHCMERLRACGLRAAAADVTSPDVAEGPFRVARVLGPDIQQIHFGYLLRRLGNPRLATIARRGLNPYPHPLA